MVSEASRLIPTSPGKHRCHYGSTLSHPGSPVASMNVATGLPGCRGAGKQGNVGDDVASRKTPLPLRMRPDSPRELGLLPTHPVLPRHTPTILNSLKWSGAPPVLSRSITIHPVSPRSILACPSSAPTFSPIRPDLRSGPIGSLVGP